ncbi:hypothetical protein BDB01DRAFT_847003 [Pilobolus umbonatus]|nr:hypothetical protein BDB01DRAFT_847003 [Pilobolus umbonatus]
MTKSNDPPPESSKSALASRSAMEPLYEKLLHRAFPESASAIEHCRNICAEFGFTVKQEASANRNIYVYCSREGLPDSLRNPKPSPQRKRPSKRCDCRWRVVLSENEDEDWEFRKSLNPTASEHNHEMMTPEEMVKAWPAEVNDLIIQMARQRLQTHEIREAVKLQFTDITWNERRFYNRLTEERKRIKQRGVIQRTQRLLLLCAQICSIAASNDEWALCVEDDLQRLFENFCRLARLKPDSVDNLVDMEIDKIQIETDRLTSHTHQLALHEDIGGLGIGSASPAKKRKSTSDKSPRSTDTIGPNGKGIQLVHVPSYTIHVRNHLHPLPEQSGGRTYAESPSIVNTTTLMGIIPQSRQPYGTHSSFYSLTSPTSSSSSSSSMPFHRQSIHPIRMHSPHIGSTHSPNEFMFSHSYPQGHPGHQQHLPYNNLSHPFPSYMSTPSAFASSSSDIPFSFESSPIVTMPRIDVRHSHDLRRQDGTHDPIYGFHTNIKVDPDIVAEEEHAMLQENDYAQRINRNYSLPMIRSSEDMEDPQWT